MLTSLRHPRIFSGLVLSAPMFSVDAGLVPNACVVAIARAVAYCAPTLPATPIKDLLPLVFRNQALIESARSDPYRYSGRGRLGTSFVCKGILDELQARAPGELRTPFIILHGTGDRVTSATASETLFRSAPSNHKTLCLFTDAWHALTAESINTRQIIVNDVLTWLQDFIAGEEALPIFRIATHPFGDDTFSSPSHPLQLFSRVENPEFYNLSHPSHIAEVLPRTNIEK